MKNTKESYSEHPPPQIVQGCIQMVKFLLDGAYISLGLGQKI